MKKYGRKNILFAIALLLLIPAARLRGTSYEFLSVAFWEASIVSATLASYRDYIYNGLVHKKVIYGIANKVTYTGKWAILYSVSTILFLAIAFLAPFIVPDWGK
jgi:hypothetical protein